MSARDWFLVLGMLALGASTIGLIISAGGHWLTWLDGQAVGVGLLVAATIQDAA